MVLFIAFIVTIALLVSVSSEWKNMDNKPMIIRGCGKLTFDYKGFKVTDGTTYFNVLSFTLIRRLLRRKIRTDTIQGEWIAVGDWIVIFKRNDKYNELLLDT